MLGGERDLQALARRVEATGNERLLELPVDVLLRAPISRIGMDVLTEVMDLGICVTVGDLFKDAQADFVISQTPGAGREIARAIEALLKGEVDTRSTELPDRLTESTLRGWAKEWGVEQLLDRKASDAGVRLGAAARSLQFAPSILELLVGRIPALPRFLAAEVQFHQMRVRQYLEEEAEDRRDAQEAERQLAMQPPPEDPAIRRLWERVKPLRDELRAELGKPSLPFGGEVHLQEDPPEILFRESPNWVTLPLGAGVPLAPTCRCAGNQRCAHVLSALDALLRVLTIPGYAKLSARLAAAAEAQPWIKLLEALDAELGDRQGMTRPIGWRLSLANGRLTLSALADDGRKKNLRLRDLWPQRSHLGRAVDQAVYELLVPEEGTAWRRESDQPPAVVNRALRLLVGHPSVWLGDGRKHLTLTVVLGELTLVARDHEGGGVELVPAVNGQPLDRASLSRIAERIAGELLVEVDEEARICTVTPISPVLAATLKLLARRGTLFPAEALGALAERLPALARVVPMQLPPGLMGAEIPLAQRALLRLTPVGVGLEVEALIRAFPDAPAHPPGMGPLQILGTALGQRIFARRELATESAWMSTELMELPLEPAHDHRWSIEDGEAALDLIAALAERTAQFDVEWPTAERRQVARTAHRADLRVAVKDKRDWFGLEGGLEIDGKRIPLANLLAAMRANQRYVALEADTFVKISDELRQKLSAAADVIFEGRSGLEVSPLAAGMIADLTDETGVTKRWRESLARIRKAADLPAATPPSLDGVTLREYQVTGYQWLMRLSAWGIGGCLADDMGLGKTIQAIALLLTRASQGPAMVVAPTSVCYNWVRELERCATGRLRSIVYRETDRDAALAALKPGDVLIVSYGLLARHADALAETHFSTLVLDEAQAIKNPSTDRARAAVRMQADFRVALSGTPIENRLAELWSLFRTVAPGLLGSWDAFRDRFAGPIERNADPERRQALARLVRPFLLRRLKSEVAKELPPRTEIRVDVELSEPERRRYDDLRKSVVAELSGAAAKGPKVVVVEQQRRFQVLAALTRLRQLACDPRLVDDKIEGPSSKLQRLSEMLSELLAEGHRVLVFSQFTSLLALVRTELEKDKIETLYLDGQTPEKQRRELIDAFQSGHGQVFLLSLKAGGTGINLTGADSVIHLDPWWNPAVEDQATDRAHRIGQTRPVTIFKMVTTRTVEDAIMAMHVEKRALVAGVLDGTGSAPVLSSDELLALLRG